MKRILAGVLVCIFLLSSCGGISLKNEEAEYEENGCLIKTNILLLGGLPDKERCEALNNDRRSTTQEWIDDFKSRAAPPDSAQDTPTLDVAEEEKRCGGGVISTVCKKYLYTGIGAHGNLWQTSRNILISTGSELFLEDIFNDEGFEKFLNQRIDEAIEKNPDEYDELWEKPQIMKSNRRDFYLTDKELVLFYQPYELSYYSRGVVEIPIRLESLRGYLNQEVFK